MNVGFTGTQHGMTDHQRKTVQWVLGRIPGTHGSFHHGDCVGADAQCVLIAWSLGFWVVRHPPITESKRAFSACHEDREPKEYLERNREIVDETEFLIAAPARELEQIRSGTWSTLRYARRLRREVLIVPPRGLSLAEVTNRLSIGLLADFHLQRGGERRGQA